MKKRLIWPLMVLVALMVLTVSCKKSRYCHCIGETYQKVQSTGDTIDFADTVVINVDRSMRCDHILYMGVEELKDGEYVTTTRQVDCKELDMDTVVTIPQEHPVDD